MALTARRRLDERRQRALTRYYLAAGAGGVAVGVHTTQFAIHDPTIGLLAPVLELAAITARSDSPARTPAPILVAGTTGRTRQACREASLARELGYHLALVGFGGRKRARNDQLVAHARAIGEVLPVMGFYLQPAVGGRPLDYRFWRELLDGEHVIALKVAPFDRYATLDVLRAVADSGRRDVAVYTGNDDHIVMDLLTGYAAPGQPAVRFVGGLLGQWACWTQAAVALHRQCQRTTSRRSAAAPPLAHPAAPPYPPPAALNLLAVASRLTDANGAIFDAANRFHGCIPGIHEVLRRQGLLAGRWCIDPNETLSAGQAEEIDRVCRAYPELNDDGFVAAHRDEWMR